MRVLFEMDKHDYDHCTHNFVRNSARSIIISGKKIAMIHSLSNIDQQILSNTLVCYDKTFLVC